MEMNRPTLWHRVLSLLRAKQFLVFYAIGLYLLDFVPGVAATWVAQRQPLASILGSDYSLIGATLRARTHLGDLAVDLLILVLAICLAAFFRAGYLRSLLGRTHAGPVDAAQFRAMAGLTALMALMDWAAGIGSTWAAASLGRAVLVEAGLLAANLLVLYADYAIVVANLGLLAAIRSSLDTVRAHLALSVGALVTFMVISLNFLGLIGPEISGPVANFAPLLIVWVLVLGSLSFVTDVLFIMVYIDSIERGRITHASR